MWDELGPGHLEKIYQKSLAIVFNTKKIKFQEQVYYSLKFRNEIAGKGFLDYLIDDKIIVELKKDGNFSNSHRAGFKLSEIIKFKACCTY